MPAYVSEQEVAVILALILLLLFSGCLVQMHDTDALKEHNATAQNISSDNLSARAEKPSPQPSNTAQPPKIPRQPPEELNLSLVWKFSTSEPVYDMDISREYIAVASYDNHFYVLNRSGEVIHTFSTKGNAEAVAIRGELLAGASFVIPEATLYLYNLSSGELVWKHTYAEQIRALDFAGETLLIGTVEGRIIALSLSGKKLWERQISKSAWGVAEIEALSNMFCVAGDDTYLYLFSVDGDLIWRKSPGKKSYLYGCGIHDKVVGFAAQDRRAGVFSHQGKKLWEFKTGFSNSDIAISDRLVAVASWDGNVYLLSHEGELLGRIPVKEPTCVVLFKNLVGFGSRDGRAYIYRVD